MRPVLNTLLALCLSAVLALTGQAVALARGAPDQVMVICTEAGPVAVAIPGTGSGDAGGHVHRCPDCVVPFISVLTQAPVRAARVMAAERIVWRPADRPMVARIATRSRHARAPPRAA